EHYTNYSNDPSTSFKENEILSVRNQLFSIADKMRQKKEYKKARFTKDLSFHMAKKKKHSSCSVLWDHIMVMVNGDIYFCIKEDKAGNIFSSSMAEMKTKPKDFRCKSCMLMCGSFKDYEEAPYKEQLANIEATLQCNLGCTMCTQKELRHPGGGMSFECFSGLVGKESFDHVSFVGGESFLNKDLFRMMELLDSKGISYEMTTNGTLFTGQNRKALKKCIGLKKINFSLDGLEKFHDSVRGEGVFKKSVRALIYSNQYWNVAVASIIRADNLSILPALREYLSARSISSQKFIYVMNISDRALQDSLEKVPGLEMQGPKCDDQVKNSSDLDHLFSELEQILSGVSFEPRVMRTDTKEFLGNRPIGECKQLQQFRYNPQGERIICEFIRNVYTEELRNCVKAARPAICTRCCKMDIHK
ncbi:MAG: radical SAM protein, partial [Thermodesulfovibrionia bacterium]|nr:radical SAM protein [Thermodesulfovibrionia bacterium]